MIGIFIPARYGSTRLPAKPLQRIGEKTIIQMVYEQALKNRYTNNIFVLTDNNIIEAEVKKFGKVLMTPETCKSGSDRIGWAVKNYNLNYDIIVNLQGDEPLIREDMINAGIKLLIEESELNVGTLVTEFKDKNEIINPNFVKVVLDKNNYALYFSRSIIPYIRDKDIETKYYKHIGLYIYRKKFLLHYISLEESQLEKCEKLEQLRILENGFKIKVAITDYDTIGIDTIEDIEKVRKYLTEKSENLNFNGGRNEIFQT